MGLFAGIIMMLFTGVGVAQAQNPQGANALLGMGAFGLIALPIFYGVGGFIGGAINALIYNIIAGLTGGIVLDLHQS